MCPDNNAWRTSSSVWINVPKPSMACGRPGCRGARLAPGSIKVPGAGQYGWADQASVAEISLASFLQRAYSDPDRFFFRTTAVFGLGNDQSETINRRIETDPDFTNNPTAP